MGGDRQQGHSNERKRKTLIFQFFSGDFYILYCGHLSPFKTLNLIGCRGAEKEPPVWLRDPQRARRERGSVSGTLGTQYFTKLKGGQKLKGTVDRQGGRAPAHS